MRNCDLILYFFYKNIVFTLPQIFYAFVAAYSGQTIYDDWYISFYNLFFTSLPLAMRALFDEDINPHKDGAIYNKYLPKLYYIGQRSVIFNGYTFLWWLLFGMAHSLVVFVLPLYVFRECLMTQQAQNNDMWSFSVTSFTSVILIVTMRLMATSRYLTWINLVSVVLLSLGIYFLYIWASNYTGFSSTYQSMVMIFQSPHYYLTVLLCVFLCYAVDLFMEAWQFEIMTSPADFLRKAVSYGEDIEKKEHRFNQIYAQIKKKYIEEDLQREEKIEVKRDLKMNKYGVKAKDKKKADNALVKRAPRNEIELEFQLQDEKEKFIIDKYRKGSDDEDEAAQLETAAALKKQQS